MCFITWIYSEIEDELSSDDSDSDEDSFSSDNPDYAEVKVYMVYIKAELTLNCIRYPALPLVHRGFHGIPKKTTFPAEFLKLSLLHIYNTLITTLFQKKKWNICTVSKWWPNNQISFRVISILAKIWKTTFPKEFFNEIWLKLGDHEYITIAEI